MGSHSGPAAAAWIAEAVPQGRDDGSWSSLAVAPDDTLHAAWMEVCPPPFFGCGNRGAQQWVVLATNTGANRGWDIELARSVSSEGIASSSIVVDAHGAVSYYDATARALPHALRNP